MFGDSCEHENRRRVLAGAVQLRGREGKRSAHEFIGLGGTSKIVITWHNKGGGFELQGNTLNEF